MKYILPFALGLLLAACNQDSTQTRAAAHNGLSLQTAANPDWQYENLRLYPVTAAAGLSGACQQSLSTLAEAMQTPGFRVLERKQFGRSNETWYHGVTIQNKTQDTVFIMSGDVVTGGNQDRVMAYHDLVLPGTVKNVEVYCVEAGRSHYYDQSASEVEKSVGAFKGYYNVASPQVRHAVQSKRNQGEVWNAVARVTEANGASSETKAYAALDQASEQKQRRDAYLQNLNGKFDALPEVVGVVAVCGDKILGVDIFGNADLFRRQFPALLHGYVAEAAVDKSAASLSDQEVIEAFQQVARQADSHIKPSETAAKYSIGDKWVHLYKK